MKEKRKLRKEIYIAQSTYIKHIRFLHNFAKSILLKGLSIMYILFKSSYKISLKWVVDILPLNCKNRFELIEGMYVNSRFFFHKSNFPKSIGYFLTRKKTVLTKEINDSVLEF